MEKEELTEQNGAITRFLSDDRFTWNDNNAGLVKIFNPDGSFRGYLGQLPEVSIDNSAHAKVSL